MNVLFAVIFTTTSSNSEKFYTKASKEKDAEVS
jgi:hypothetical protein